ncbi:serine proteinase stubble-like [Portunus trituberculatus]|uniref:serine proteinase stubble-like n=1 Tax=Portunus trituberculatus TaxID=210409 RepID=UPI001E1D1B5A|nr:serine proteinase stubble-like [Portunus trituberculatus]
MIMQRGRKLAALLLLAICACAAAEEWSWGPDTDEAAPDPTPAARQTPVLKQQEEQQAAAAPQEATKDGEDRQARFLGLGLGKKLCSLGIGDCAQKRPYKGSGGTDSSYTSYTHESHHQTASHTSQHHLSTSSHTSYTSGSRHPAPHHTPQLPPHKQVVHKHTHTHLHHGTAGVPPRPVHHVPHTDNFKPLPLPPHQGGFKPLPLPTPHGAPKPFPVPHGGVELEGVVPEGHHGHSHGPQYKEDCVCVHASFCADYDVVGREQPGDIVHLIDPRTRSSTILSNDTLAEDGEPSKTTTTTTTTTTTAAPEAESRVRRDLLATTNSTAALAEGRALSYRPGVTGCGAAYVCCRNPQFDRPPHNSYTCGRGNPNGVLARVKTPDYVQGTAHFGEFPWHAAVLKDNEQYVCGAVLVDARHVLTAAHCVAGLDAYAVRIRLGDWDVSSTYEFYSHVNVPVQWIVVHPEYYSGDLSNDLAVIRLQTYVDFAANPHIRPVCLPPHHSDFVGHRCVSTGWGKDAFDNHGKFQSLLRKVELPVVDRATCQAALAYERLGSAFRLSPGALCAGGEEGRDTCQGDGGGALVCKDYDGAFQLAGLVSWGLGCGRAGVPGVYVDVAHYAHWIHEITEAH